MYVADYANCAVRRLDAKTSNVESTTLQPASHGVGRIKTNCPFESIACGQATEHAGSYKLPRREATRAHTQHKDGCLVE